MAASRRDLGLDDNVLVHPDSFKINPKPKNKLVVNSN